MRAYPGLCGSRIQLLENNTKMVAEDGSSAWGTVCCPVDVPKTVGAPSGPELSRGDSSGGRGGRGGRPVKSGKRGGGSSKFDDAWRLVAAEGLTIKSGRVTVEMQVVGSSTSSSSGAANRRMIGFGIATAGSNLDGYLGEDNYVRSYLADLILLFFPVCCMRVMCACVWPLQGWSYQGTAETWHSGTSNSYFRPYGIGDTVSFELDMERDTLEFFVNGKSGGVAYSGFVSNGGDAGFIPAVSIYYGGDTVAMLGLKSGEGERQFSSSDHLDRVKYVGRWKNGDMNGWGRMEYKSGASVEAEFAGGRPVGPALSISSDGDECYYIYANGEVVDETGPEEYAAVKAAKLAEAEAEKEAAGKPATAAAGGADGDKDKDAVAAKPKEVWSAVSGTFKLFNDQLFVFSPGMTSSSLSLDDDLCTVTSTRGGTSIATGCRGFSRGVHYWEVQAVTQQEQGGIFIGVCERNPSVDSWRDYGFVSYSAVQSTRGGERLYGPFYIANDYIGVLLNMDEGYLAFVKDAEVRLDSVALFSLCQVWELLALFYLVISNNWGSG